MAQWVGKIGRAAVRPFRSGWFWAVVILVGIMAFPYGFRRLAEWSSSPGEPPPEPPVKVLACSTDRFEDLPNVPRQVLEVPPRNCWSDWLVIPTGLRSWAWDTNERVIVQYAFPNGKWSEELEGSPLVRRNLSQPASGIRFKNARKEPVRITMTFRFR